MKKIDYTNKHGIMVGYIDNSQNVVAVETGWKTTPEALYQVSKIHFKHQASLPL